MGGSDWLCRTMIAVMLIGVLTGLPLASKLIAALSFSAYALTPSLIPAPGSSPLSSILYATCNFHTGNFNAECVPTYLAYLISMIFQLTGAIFLLMIILGGYQYVIGKAGGGGGEDSKARVRFAIIGFLVTALSFYIVDFVLSSL